MSAFTPQEKEKKHRKIKEVKKWTRNDETKLINYLKQHPEFELPTARAYYTKFLEENEMRNVYWKIVLYKIRNMLTVYRRAKEYETNKKNSNDFDASETRGVMLNICWYVDEFDALFPSDMSNYSKPISKEFSSDDERSNQESVYFNDNNNSSSNFNDPCLQEQPTASYLPKSIERDILAVQMGKLSYKRRKFDDDDDYDVVMRQEEYELARERFNFEKEKFRQEIRVREKGIDSRERSKIMELQMKERIAMRELELKEKLALQSIEKQEPYNNVYHNLD